MVANPRNLWNWCRSKIMAYYRSLTRHFNYSSDMFFGLEFLMTVAGARFGFTNVRLRRCWNIYRWAIQLPVLLILWNTFFNIYQQENLEIILSCLQSAVCVVTANIRMVLVLRYYEPLMNIRKYVNLRIFGRNLQPSRIIREEAFYRIRKTVIFTIGVMFTVCTNFFMVDTANLHATKLPCDFAQKFPLLQKIFDKVFCMVFYGVGFKVLLVTLITPMILNGLTTEMKVIALKFPAIFENTEKRVHSDPGSSRVQKNNFWQYLQEEFDECIELHIDFLDHLDEIRPLLNAICLVFYYSTVVSLASGAIYVTKMNSVNLFAFQTLFYCLWVAFECFFVTKMVDMLTNVCKSISWEIYDLDWPTKLQFETMIRQQYRSIRMTMITVMAVAQQPLRLNCFGLFEFTQKQFYELLNKTYSLYTFFRDFA